MTVDGVSYTTESFDLKADVSGNGKIDEADLTLLRQYFAGYSIVMVEYIADLDGNGKLTRKDVMILARYLAGWPGYDQYFS